MTDQQHRTDEGTSSSYRESTTIILGTSSAPSVSEPLSHDDTLEEFSANTDNRSQTTSSQGTNEFNSALIEAIIRSNSERVQQLLENAYANPLLTNYVKTYWVRMFSLALAVDCASVIYAFLKAGIPEHIVDGADYVIPLLFAVSFGDDVLVRRMLEYRGPKCLENTPEGPTLLMHAIKIAAQVNVGVPMLRANTNVGEALVQMEVNVAAAIVDAGVNMDSPVEDDLPLHVAAFLGNEDMVDMLIAKGASRTCAGPRHRNAAEAAEAGHHYELADKLDVRMRSRRLPGPGLET